MKVMINSSSKWHILQFYGAVSSCYEVNVLQNFVHTRKRCRKSGPGIYSPVLKKLDHISPMENYVDKTIKVGQWLEFCSLKKRQIKFW